MKKIIFIFSLLLISSVSFSQKRELPNQFRDYLNYQQQFQKPIFEKKDGKVIITMTDDQFNLMRQLRMSQRGRFVNLKSQPLCDRCVKKHKRHFKRQRNHKF